MEGFKLSTLKFEWIIIKNGVSEKPLYLCLFTWEIILAKNDTDDKAFSYFQNPLSHL